MSFVRCRDVAACDAVCGDGGCTGDGPEKCEDCIKGYEYDEDNDTGCHGMCRSSCAGSWQHMFDCLLSRL